ncbi:hypothetical protein SCP_0114030 [Sparassis crispa]|uniref:Uncharacterized protein n=1 Tax=Sparassis crispa TaxID=139825 RepID=A0A401G8M3_9APHY|nr:hypothetical protein SCP_0114030 [Sparassis crispa]GBE78514.1 hypothetical protein SCP_0114030 [Sparassis crispa]
MNRYDYAYRIRSVYKLKKPSGITELKARYRIKAAPRGIIYLSAKVSEDIVWSAQECILPKLLETSFAEHSVSTPLSKEAPFNVDGDSTGLKRCLADNTKMDVPEAKREKPAAT